MNPKAAAVFEPSARERQKLVQALAKAGLKVTAAASPEELKGEGLVVLGPTLKQAAQRARAVREQVPEAVLLAAQAVVHKAAHADGVLPLPVSAPDLKVRLPELRRLKTLDQHSPATPRLRERPGEGISDPLTGFYTFTHFKEVVFTEVKRARRYGIPLGIALLAFDGLPVSVTGSLKEQLYGGLALAIRRSLRDTDFPVQYNPERVILLMPHTDLQGALVVSRRVCERVERASLAHEGRVLHPTISVGVAAAPTPGRELSFADLVQHASTSLASAQEAGGNRVEFYDTAAAAGAAADDGSPA